MTAREVTFGPGKLGFIAQGSDAGIRIIHLTKDSQAYNHGLQVGDIIRGMNGKPFSETMHDPKNSEEFAKVVGGMPRPITLEIVSAQENPTFKLNEENIKLAAGQMYRREIYGKPGQTLRLKFHIAEEGCDIGFAIEEEGHDNLVYPYYKVYDKRNPCGPSSFELKNDGKLTLVWDNSHSWLKAKTLTYFVEVMPNLATPDKIEKLKGEKNRVRGVIQLVNQKIAATERQLEVEKANRAELEKTLAGIDSDLQELYTNKTAKSAPAEAPAVPDV